MIKDGQKKMAVIMSELGNCTKVLMMTRECFHSTHQQLFDQDYQVNSTARSEQFFNLSVEPSEQATGDSSKKQLPEMT